jgi:glucose/arabinose dehydrogenase
MRKNSYLPLSTSLIFCFSILISGCDSWFDDKEDENDLGSVYAANLDTPWEMEFAPDGRLFVTQRSGSIVVIENGKVETWIKLDSVVEEVGESGLFGIEIDPDFQQNHYVYFAYTYAASKSPLMLVNKIVRYRDVNGTPAFDKVLMDGIEGNYLHNVGALEFGPDKMLYATSGRFFSRSVHKTWVH